MRKLIGLTLTAALLSALSASAADNGTVKVKTKSNIKNDRALGVTTQGDVPDDGLVFSWGDEGPRASMPSSSQGSYQLSRADWTPVDGPAFTDCREVCADSARLASNPVDLNDRAATSGPGSVTLVLDIRSSDPGHPPGPGGYGLRDGGCPADGTHFKDVVISGGRNPGANYRLRDALVTHCDATGLTISYKHAINEKGTGGKNH